MKAPWRLRFLKVVERTLFELNLKFTNYSIGQTANSEFKRGYFDAATQGLEFADELTVTSAIVNDLIGSTFINGDFDEDHKDELKFYKVNREMPYPKKPSNRVDLILQRVNYETIIKNGGGKINSKQSVKAKQDHKKAFIEAKRAKRYTNKLLSNNLIEGKSTYLELKKNIRDRFINKDNQYNYILVWGIWNKENEKDNNPTNYLNNLTSGMDFKIDSEIRWIPLGWETKTQKKNPKSLEIKKWCWILLGEIEK